MGSSDAQHRNATAVLKLSKGSNKKVVTTRNGVAQAFLRDMASSTVLGCATGRRSVVFMCDAL
jgi:hypothetical protein